MIMNEMMMVMRISHYFIVSSLVRHRAVLRCTQQPVMMGWGACVMRAGAYVHLAPQLQFLSPGLFMVLWCASTFFFRTATFARQ